MPGAHHPPQIGRILDGGSGGRLKVALGQPILRGISQHYNSYDAYEQRAGGRIIPVVILQPISPG
jgi:hypothetical protein